MSVTALRTTVTITDTGELNSHSGNYFLLRCNTMQKKRKSDLQVILLIPVKKILES